MRINEITLHPFIVRVRVTTGNGSTVVQYKIEADGQRQARVIAERTFGVGNVLSVVAMSVVTSENTKLPLTADQLKLKSLSDQQKKYSDASKQERARQKLAKAQKSVLKAASKGTLTNY